MSEGEDMKARAALEAALRDADRRTSDFLAVLSHEIRTPLTALRSAVYLLERATAGSRQEARAREIVGRQTDHLTRLVDDLLDLSRISHDKIALTRSRFDARDVIRRACEDVQPAFDQRGVTLALDLAPEPLWLDADSTRVAQIAGNLLSNALKFTPRAGSVVVRLHASGEGTCELRVRDTGVGIDPPLLERIFDPFAEADRTRDKARGGLGIGLALVKSLAKLHGGAARAESEGEGRGAEVIVSLPLAAPPEVEAAPRSTTAPGGLSVLIVEDDADAGQTLAELLELQGHRVRVSANGRAGLAALDGWTPDAILCDIGLPDISGYEVVRQVRKLANGGAPLCVAVTGYAQPEDIQRARDAGFDAHLRKPPAMDQLHEMLGKLAVSPRPRP